MGQARCTGPNSSAGCMSGIEARNLVVASASDEATTARMAGVVFSDVVTAARWI